MAKKSTAKKKAVKKAVKKAAAKAATKSLAVKKTVMKKAAAKRPAGRMSAMSRRADAGLVFDPPTDTASFSDIAKFSFLLWWMQGENGQPFPDFPTQVSTVKNAFKGGTLAGAGDLKSFVEGIDSFVNAAAPDTNLVNLITTAQIAVYNLKTALSNPPYSLWGPCGAATMAQVAQISQMPCQ
jgi:hypothetical protein